MARVPNGRRHPSRWLASVPAEQALPLMLAVLLGLAAASFLIHERAIARSFGFPLDGGWLDLALARSVLGGPRVEGARTESPGYVLVLTCVEALARGDAAQILFVAKLLSLAALSVIGWASIRLVRSLSGTDGVSAAAIALMVPLSPLLVWLGASGLGMAWGVALVTLGLAEIRGGRHSMGTALVAAAIWFAPAAFAVLVATFLATRERPLRRLGLAAAFVLPWAAWYVLTPGPPLEVPSLVALWNWVRNWLSLIGIAWPGLLAGHFSGYARAAVHPILLPALAIVGAWRVRRTDRLLALSAALPALVMWPLIPHPGALGRMLLVGLPATIVLAAVGLDQFVFRSERGVLRGGRVAHVLVVLYVLLSGPAFWRVRTVYAWQVENTVRIGREAGGWVARRAAPGDRVATVAPGAIGWFSGLPVIDLTNPRAIDRPRGPWPAWIAIPINSPLPDLLLENYRAIHSVSFRVQAGVYPPGPLIIFRRTYQGGMAAR